MTISCGQVYQDLDGERRKRVVSRYIKVVGVANDEQGVPQYAILMNNKTHRLTEVSAKRLLNPSRFYLMVDPVKHHNPIQDAPVLAVP